MAIEIRDEPRLVERRLRRSLDHRVIAGVCGGLAEWLRWDVTVIRLAFVVAGLVTSLVPVALLYAVLWLVIPEERPRLYREEWWE